MSVIAQRLLEIENELIIEDVRILSSRLPEAANSIQYWVCGFLFYYIAAFVANLSVVRMQIMSRERHTNSRTAVS